MVELGQNAGLLQELLVGLLTQFGRQVRAVAADRETAQLYGVPVGRLSILSFGIAGR